jgi:hypothetical protein
MRGVALLAIVVVGAAAPLACGTLVAATSSAGDPDAGDGAPAETTFACGNTRCLVGMHACCLFPTTASCIALNVPQGCAAADGGLAAGPDGAAAPVPGPLECTSANNCPFVEDCCWSAATGASCQRWCQNGLVPLCALNASGGSGGCGYSNGMCVQLPGGPSPMTIGQCQDTGGSSGGRSSSGFR